MLNQRYLRVLLLVALIVGTWTAPRAAAAQQLMIGSQQRYDKVRVSGFLWRAKPEGLLDLDAFGGLPGFGGGVDITDTLGFEDNKNGFVVEGNFAAGRRHRFIVAYTDLNANAVRSIDFPGIGPVAPVVVSIDTELDFRELHAYYNFLLTVSPQAEFGVIGGVGWFDVDALLLSSFGDAAGRLDQAIPVVGSNLLINAKGPARGYVEVTGFPRVNVDNLSGWQLDFQTRFELFFGRTYGVVVGYRYYRINVDDAQLGAAVDVKWKGLMFGAQVRY